MERIKRFLKLGSPERCASLEYLARLFLVHNGELYLVGGCVRDLLLGREPKDYDLCTNLTPTKMKEILNIPAVYHVIDTGIKHGTVTAHEYSSKYSYEITTFRIDGKYSDGRHPDTVVFTTSLEEDLKRRDLTINSLAYDILKDELIVLNNECLQDLLYGVVRCVGDPAERFEEDALRMLRAIRFAAQYNYSFDHLTYSAISMCAPLLKSISKERIRDELCKILMSDNPHYVIFLVETGLEKYMFDGLTPLTDCLHCDHQNPWHYTDVLHHILDALRNSPQIFNIRLALLFHDIGKPEVKKLKPGTTDHYRYIGHPEASVVIADKLMDILRFDNNTKKVVHNFVLYHDYPVHEVSEKKFKKLVVAIGEKNFDDFLDLRTADTLAHNFNGDSGLIRGISLSKQRFIELMNNPVPLRLKDLAINGDDLLQIGLSGAQIGEALNSCLDLVLSEPKKNEKDTLLKICKKKYGIN